MTGAADWRTRVGDVWAAEWRRTDRSFTALSRHLDAAILAAAPLGPFRALDIGCGAGATSLSLKAARPDAGIIGVDLSEALVAVARERLADASLSERGRAEGRVDFHVGDAVMVARKHAPFDLLYSRHGVMFFDDPVAGFGALREAVSPDARLVFSCFRARALNLWAGDLVEAVTGRRPAETDGPGPFAFADSDRVAALLAAAGWQVQSAAPIDFAYIAGEGADPVSDAADFLTRIGPLASTIAAAPTTERAQLAARLSDVLTSYRVDTQVRFPAAAWIWHAQTGDKP